MKYKIKEEDGLYYVMYSKWWWPIWKYVKMPNHSHIRMSWMKKGLAVRYLNRLNKKGNE